MNTQILLVHLRQLVLILHFCLIVSVIQNFSQKNFPKNFVNPLKPLIPFKTKVKNNFFEKNGSFINCKFQNPMLKHVNSKVVTLGARVFSPFEVKFWFKTNQWLQDIQEKILNANLTGEHFLSGSKMKTTANLNQNCPKIAIRNFWHKRFKQKWL